MDVHTCTGAYWRVAKAHLYRDLRAVYDAT